MATAHHTIIFLLHISQLFVYNKSTKYFTSRNRVNIWILCIEKLYYNFKPPIWYVWMIFMATAQNPIFSLLRNYYFASANLPIIYLVQIDQLFHHWDSSKHFITVHRKIVWQLLIAYLEIFQGFILLLRKAQIFRYCASIILLLRISKLFMKWKSTNYFTTANRLHNSLLCIEKLYDNFKSPIWKYFDDLYGSCAKPNF